MSRPEADRPPVVDRPHRPASYMCLDLTFSFRSVLPVLAAVVDELYAPFRTDREATVALSVAETSSDGGRRFQVEANGGPVRTAEGLPAAVAHVVWEIGQRVIGASSRSLLLHAAAAELDRRAVLVSGPSGRGKSTLVAGLAAAGFRYLTDDVVAIDRSSMLVRPYPKPISLAGPLLGRFPSLLPRTPGWESLVADEGFLVPSSTGAPPGRPSTPLVVIEPRYSPGATARLVPVPRPQALLLLLEQSFNADLRRTGGLELLASIVRGCACYRLEYGDLDRAVAMITTALQDGGGAPPADGC